MLPGVGKVERYHGGGGFFSGFLVGGNRKIKMASNLTSQVRTLFPEVNDRPLRWRLTRAKISLCPVQGEILE